MKAIVAHEFGGAEKLGLEEIADPAPGPGEVLIRVKAAGVNPSDVYMLSGAYAVTPDLPYTPGYDAAGVVEAVGEGVAALAPGDRVATGGIFGLGATGAFAELMRRPAADCVKIPDSLSFAAGAAFGVPYATAHYALFARGGAKAGDTVFIHGASGAVGTAAIQLAKRAGLTVIGSAGTSEGLDLVRAEGADHVVNHGAEGYLEEVRAATGGDGPALILEMLADRNLAADMDLAPKYGRILVIGCRGEVTIAPRVAMMKDLDIRGLALFNASRAEAEAIMADLVAAAADGSIRPVIRAEMALAEAADAMRLVMAPGAKGKIVLAP